jgi:hypothetical protein
MQIKNQKFGSTEASANLGKISNIIGGSWPSDYTEEQVEAEAESIFSHAKLCFPSLTVEDLENDGPGHASRFEEAWGEVERSRKFLQEIGAIYNPNGWL